MCKTKLSQSSRHFVCVHRSESDDHSSSRHPVGLEGGVGRGMSLSLKVIAAPSCCHSNKNPSVLLPSFFLIFTLESSLDTSTLTTSTMFFFFVCGCDWCITEAEEHRGSTGFLDGQCVRAAQFHQTGPRPESHYAGRPGHPRPSGPDGLQVSLCLWMWVWV